MSEGGELLAQIARVRAEFAKIERLVREIAHARELGDLIEKEVVK
jgi:hypothetical protein